MDKVVFFLFVVRIGKKMEVPILEENRLCIHCNVKLDAGLSILDAWHHIRYCSKNPECKVLWCRGCRTRMRGRGELKAHMMSEKHREMMNATSKSGKVVKSKYERDAKRERAIQNWKDGLTPWDVSGAQPCASDFFRKGGKKYSVIVADPPWQYRRRWTKGSALEHYPTMDIKSLTKLPVQQLCADQCMLLLWVTGPQLPVGTKLLQDWGFEYKTVYRVWVKTFPSGKPVSSLGNYTKSSCELVLLGGKGRITTLREDRTINQVLMAERPKEHSKKPKEFWNDLKSYLGSGYKELNKIELFARSPRKGWDSWGNETTRFESE